MIENQRGASIIGNFILLTVSGTVLIGVICAAVLLTLPDVRTLEKCFTTSLFQVRVCPGSDNYVPLKSISPYMVHALISSEDAAFYSHKGFDWHEIQQSIEQDLRTGELKRGGSTLTQQLAKNAFLTKDKSFIRKFKEAYLAYMIEKQFRKDFILEKYLNMVEFGPNLFGIKAASQSYFNKSPAALHPLEAAFLAHLLPNPKVYSQGARKGELTKFSKKMVQIILRRMMSFKKITEPAFDTAMANLDGYPWDGLSIGSFDGTPNYSLDADDTSAFKGDLEADRESLRELLRDSQAVDKENGELDVEEDFAE